MRKLGWFLTCSFLILGSVALVDGQQPGGGGFGGFGGGFGAAPGSAPLTLLNNKDVKKDLDITDEQLEKLPAEVLVAISKVLNEKQYNRFKQIELQTRKNSAFKDPGVQTALSMTAEQKKSIASILEEEAKDIAELQPKFGGGAGGKGGKGAGGKGGFGGFGKENQEKQDTVRKEAKEKIYTVLSKDQRKTWRELIGEEFKFTPAPAFGGFGKDKKVDPKKDTE